MDRTAWRISGSKTQGLLLCLLLCLGGCSDSKKKEGNDDQVDLPFDAQIVEDFNSALGDFLEEAEAAIEEAEIDPEHFEYDQGSVSISFSSRNSYFDRFLIGIRSIRLVNLDGYVFSLYDAKDAGSVLSVDFSAVTNKAQLVVNQPLVPTGPYQSVAIDFDFVDTDIRAWLDRKRVRIFLYSDDARTLSIDQPNYQISVGLGSGPLVVSGNSHQHINIELNLDDSIKQVRALDNALPDDNSGLMIFHPSLDTQVDIPGLPLFIEGKFNQILADTLHFTPSALADSERFTRYFDRLPFRYTDATRFALDYATTPADEAVNGLALLENAFVRAEGTLKFDPEAFFAIDHLMTVDATHFEDVVGARILKASGGEWEVSGKRIDLEKFTETAVKEKLPVSSRSATYNFHDIHLAEGASSAAKPHQRVMLAKSGDTVHDNVFLQPSGVIGPVKEKRGESAEIALWGINRFNRDQLKMDETIDVDLGSGSIINEGDRVALSGYFWGDRFKVTREAFATEQATFLIWIDEVPPNQALDKAFRQEESFSTLRVTGDMLKKSLVLSKRYGLFTRKDDIPEIKRLDFTHTTRFFLESYTTLNPHVQQFSSFEELKAALDSMVEAGAHVYSIVFSGLPQGNSLTSVKGDNSYLKIRIRGRWIGSEMNRLIYDEDVHGEELWNGFSAEQIAAIFGGVAGALLLEFILERKKLGPIAQLTAPDFCKPGKKSKSAGGGSPGGANTLSQLRSAKNTIGSIGGIASCLKKLAAFRNSEPDLQKYRKQINPDALYIGGSMDSSKNRFSALLVLKNKKLSNQGKVYYRSVENREKIQRVLNAGKKLESVFNKRFGPLGSLNGLIREAGYRLQIHSNRKALKDDVLFSRLVELDDAVRTKVLEKLKGADRNRFVSAVEAAWKVQEKGGKVQQVADAFNDALELKDKDRVAVSKEDADRDSTKPVDVDEQNLNQQNDVEAAFFRFQVEQNAETRAAVGEAFGTLEKDLDFTEDSISRNFDRIQDEAEVQRKALLTNKATVLATLLDNQVISPGTFSEIQTRALVIEKLSEDIKRNIIELETRGDSVDTNRLAKEFQQVQKEKLRHKGSGSKHDLLRATLGELTNADAEFIRPDNIIKRKKR